MIPTKPRKGKQKLRIFPLILVFVCLALIVVGLLHVIKIKYTVKGESYYFFCVKQTDDAYEAECCIVDTQKKGGAGYAYSNLGQYYIMASVYLDEDTASSIARKNGGTVFSLSFPSLSFFNKNQAQEQSVLYTKICGYIHSLITLSYGFDTKKESADTVFLELENYENTIKTDSHPVFSGLNLKKFENFGVNLKYYACDLIFTAYKYFC